MRIIPALVAFFTLSLVASAKDGWLTDFHQALALAKAQHKPILLDFTGSDWCPYCIKLDKEVFSTPEWKSYAAKNVIQMEVDFPHNVPQSEKVKRQNLQLAQELGVPGFPILVLVSPESKVLGEVDYGHGGPATLIESINRTKK